MKKFRTISQLILLAVFTILLVNISKASSPIMDMIQTLDSIYVDVDQSKGPYLIHPVKKQQTLYSLAIFYQTNIETLKKYNPYLNQRGLKVADDLKIPISNKNFMVIPPSSGLQNEYATLFYKIKPKDNLFRIAKRYFNIPMEEALKNNNKLSHNLSIGESFVIGWVSIKGFSAENFSSPTENAVLDGTYTLEEKYGKDYKSNSVGSSESATISNDRGIKHDVSTPSPTTSSENYTVVEEVDYSYPFSPGKNFKTAQGIAIWNKTSTRRDVQLYVMHRTAKVNTQIEIINPMYNNSVMAKVVGNIPYGAYGEDVKLILSPKTAEYLGAKDSRFFVKYKFVE